MHKKEIGGYWNKMAKKKGMGMLKMGAEYLVAIGAVNWGTTALGYNLVDMLAEAVGLPALATLVYALVGLSGLYMLGMLLGLLKE